MMGSFEKWIGGGLGWFVGGPIGGLIGFAVGAVVGAINGKPSTDAYTTTRPTATDYTSARSAFNVSLTVLIAAILKVDGKVVKSELDYVKHFFVNQFGKEAAAEATLMLRDILKKDIPVKDVCQQIRVNMDYSSRLQLLQLLFNISLADGTINISEQELINSISGYLSISMNDFASIKNMFVPETDSSYKILEIEPSATNEEVKKAYRKMAMKFHPDKVSHLGEEYKNSAEEKFRKVNEAYELIKKERNMV